MLEKINQMLLESEQMVIDYENVLAFLTSIHSLLHDMLKIWTKDEDCKYYIMMLESEMEGLGIDLTDSYLVGRDILIYMKDTF